jgi:hypothetical protein
LNPYSNFLRYCKLESLSPAKEYGMSGFMDNIHGSAENGKTASKLVTTAPSVAGALPPNFQSAFVTASLRDCEYLRLPPPQGRCPLSSLSRTTLLELGERGLIILKRIRRPGATRGIVLIEKQSLLDYLHSLTATGEQSQKLRESLQLCRA